MNFVTNCTYDSFSHIELSFLIPSKYSNIRERRGQSSVVTTSTHFYLKVWGQQKLKRRGKLGLGFFKTFDICKHLFCTCVIHTHLQKNVLQFLSKRADTFVTGDDTFLWGDFSTLLRTFIQRNTFDCVFEKTYSWKIIRIQEQRGLFQLVIFSMSKNLSALLGNIFTALPSQRITNPLFTYILHSTYIGYSQTWMCSP